MNPIFDLYDIRYNIKEALKTIGEDINSRTIDVEISLRDDDGYSHKVYKTIEVRIVKYLYKGTLLTVTILSDGDGEVLYSSNLSKLKYKFGTNFEFMQNIFPKCKEIHDKIIGLDWEGMLQAE